MGRDNLPWGVKKKWAVAKLRSCGFSLRQGPSSLSRRRSPPRRNRCRTSLPRRVRVSEHAAELAAAPAEQQRQQQLARDRESARAPSKLESPEVKAPSAAVAGAACREIRIVDIKGVTRLSAHERDQITDRYQGRCLGVSDVERLLGEITKAYIDHGFVAARAYLPAQDLTSGTLHIIVIEGKLTKVELRGKDGGVNTATAFPFLVGKPVNLRSIEQGLDQINRLASNSATIDLQPGAGEGDTVLVVHNQPRRRLLGNVSLDNLGSRSTGQIQGAVTGSLDDILGLNEYVSVTRRQSSPFNRDHIGRSSSETYFASVPLGPLTFSGGASNSRYRTETALASGGSLELTGGSRSRFGTIDWVAVRGRTGQVGLSATLNSRENTNFLNGQKLDVSSRKLTVLDLDIRGQTTRFGGFATLGLGMSLGLDWLGAVKDQPNLTAETPRAQFVKYRLNASYFYATALRGQRIEFTTSLAAQYSSHPLFGTEQFSIGGVYSVRGFRETTIADDNGFYLRNDVGFPHKVGRWFGAVMVVRPYVGVDVGYARGRIDNGFGGTLAGGAIGSTVSFGRTFVDLFVTKRFAAPDRLNDEGVILFGRLSIRI